MSNITLVSTIHEENGKCNSDELYKIIASISPEVIFEEVPNDLFDKFYNGKQIFNEPLPLEVKSIKKYLQNHGIKHIPVDIAVSPNPSENEINYMFDTFGRYDIYKNLKYEHNLLTIQEGFDYLNSKKCLDLFEKMKIVEKQLIEFTGIITGRELRRIYKLFHKEHDNREKAMLRNIYNYSKENQYNQAVFLLGCAHRKSIIQKITEYEKMAEIKLNWTIYGDKKNLKLLTKTQIPLGI